jgi:hypothetical protein
VLFVIKISTSINLLEFIYYISKADLFKMSKNIQNE